MVYSKRKIACLSVISVLLLGSTPSRLNAEPIQSPDSPSPTGGVGNSWYKWNNLRVDVRGGVRLMNANGSALRASAIKVYAGDITWQSGYVDGFSTSPADNSTGFAGIYVFQAGGPDCALTAASTNPGQSTVCNLSNQADIYVRVNDGTIGNTNDGHGDNGGSFDLAAKILKP